MNQSQLIDEYLAGPNILRDAIRGMTEEDLAAVPVAGKWSTRQVICHLADFEPVYADRIKRVVAEDCPTFFAGDPDLFAARLAYEARDIEEELQLIETVRQHVGRILRTLHPDDFQREGNHSEDGRVTLQRLVELITGHIPHHVKFIEEKRTVLAQA